MKNVFFISCAMIFCAKGFARYVPYEDTPYGRTSHSVDPKFFPPEVVPMNFSSSWSVPRSVLGADANPLNAVPFGIAGKNLPGNTPLLMYAL